MKWLITTFALIVLAAVAEAQPPVPGYAPLPPAVPGYVPTSAIEQPEVKPNKSPVVNAEQLLHEHAYEQSVKERKPLIRFIGVNARKVQGCIVVKLSNYNGSNFPRVIVARPNEDAGDVLAASASDGEIRQAAGLEASRAAVPFSGKDAAQPIADGEPWLSSLESAKIKAMWPRSREYPVGLRLYSLKPLYQAMSTTNNGRTQINVPTSIEHEESHPFLVSGGMVVNNRVLPGWRSTKGLLLPSGKKISVWREATDVRAFALVDRWRWRFPVGTVAYDILSTDRGIFEIRSQERGEDGWMTLQTFRDKEKSPAGYAGLNQSCVSCHSTAGAIFDVEGRIYRRERWGSDGRFSWRPYDESGQVDRRWPIEVH